LRLLWHPESSCLFYSETFETDGLVEDVTGVPWAEQQAKEQGLIMSKQPPSPTDSVPTFRDGAVYDLAQAMSKAMQVRQGDLLKTCLTCVSFRESDEWCSMWKLPRPPARIIAYGCAEYSHTDEIPF
jgi:hypothetical protein